MKKRLIDNWVTTVIGIAILILGGYLTYKQVIEWQTFIASLGAVMLLLRGKDSLLGLTPKE